MKETSFYRVDCWHSGETVQIEARDGAHWCPNCQASLTIEWHGERRRLERQPT